MWREVGRCETHVLLSFEVVALWICDARKRCSFVVLVFCSFEGLKGSDQS